MSFRFLVIGAGPAGLYTSKFLTRLFPKHSSLDLIDKEMLPGGLLRWGVAPDHAELRSSISQFDSLFKTDSFNYFGNVGLSPSAGFKTICQNYSAIIFTNGAENTKKIKLKNEEICSENIFNSTDFFHFYNGKNHELPEKFKNLKNARKVIIIGNGNVTIDMARIFTAEPSKLAKNERVNTNFINLLSENQINSIDVIGRRGVIQSACAVKELKDLLNESTFSVHVLKNEFEKSMTDQSLKDCDDKVELTNRQNRKKLKLFESLIDLKPKRNKLNFRFLLAPFSVVKKNGKNFLICKKMNLVDTEIGVKIEEIIGEFEEFEFDFLIKNLGFEIGKPFFLDVLEDDEVPTYKCGWFVSKGKGTIADLIIDSQNKASIIFQDSLKGKLPEKSPESFLREYLKKINKIPENEEMFIGNKIPEKVLDKTSYLQFREKEKETEFEIYDSNFVKSYLKKVQLLI